MSRQLGAPQRPRLQRAKGHLWLGSLLLAGCAVPVLAQQSQAPAASSTTPTQASQPGAKTATPPSQTHAAKSTDGNGSGNSTSDGNAFPEAESEAAQQKAQKAADQEGNAFPEAKSEAAQQAADSGNASSGAANGQPAGEPYSSSATRSQGLDLLGNKDAPATDGAGHFLNNPELAKEDVRVGKFYLSRGNYPGAYSRLKEATQVGPGNLEAVYLLAEAARKTSHLNEAETNFRLYLDVEPKGKYAKDARKALAEMAGK